MNLNGDTTAIVVDTDLSGLSVNGNFDFVHVGVIVFVVRGIHDNFVEDFVQTRDVGDFTELHRLGRRVVHPHLRRGSLDGSNIRIGTFDDVF
jgi:hypothetical protein